LERHEYRAAITMLELIADEYSMLQWDQAAYELLAECHLELGDPRAVVETYNRAVAGTPPGPGEGLKLTYLAAVLRLDAGEKVSPETRALLSAASPTRSGGVGESGVQRRPATTRFYFVRGEVTNPGTYRLTARTTLLRALESAGGPTEHAAERVSLIRDNMILRFDITPIRKGTAADPAIAPGDIITVDRGNL
jgi:hypothetical protein